MLVTCQTAYRCLSTSVKQYKLQTYLLSAVSLCVLFIGDDLYRKHIETGGDMPPPMSGSSASVIGDKQMYLFAGHHNNGPSSSVSFILSNTCN